VSTSFAVLVRLGVALGAFVIGRRWGAAVAVVAALAVLTLSSPTAIIRITLAFAVDENAASRLVSTIFRAQFVLALVLLVASISTKLPGLIILCGVCFLLAALYRLTLWAVERAS